MSYGSDIAAAVPEVASAEPAAATALKAWCDEVDTRLTAKVTPAGFSMNDDLDFLTTYGAENVQSLGLAAAAAEKTGAGNARRVYAYNGELYYTNSSGTTTRITNAGAIDVGSISGIAGDYSADADAQVDYTTATDLYRMLANLTNLQRAIVEVGQLRVYGTGNNPSFRVTLDSGTLAASYTMTLPTDVPGSTSLLQWTAAGQVSSTRSPAMDSPTMATPTISGKATFQTDFAHPTRSIHIAAPAGFINAGTGAIQTDGHWTSSADAAAWCIPIPADEGWTVQSIDFHLNTSANAGTRTIEVGYYNETVGSLTFPGGAYDDTYAGTSTRITRSLNVTDFPVGAVDSSGVLIGLLYARFVSINADEFWGVTVNYARV